MWENKSSTILSFQHLLSMRVLFKSLLELFFSQLSERSIQCMMLRKLEDTIRFFWWNSSYLLVFEMFSYRVGSVLVIIFVAVLVFPLLPFLLIILGLRVFLVLRVLLVIVFSALWIVLVRVRVHTYRQNPTCHLKGNVMIDRKYQKICVHLGILDTSSPLVI